MKAKDMVKVLSRISKHELCNMGTWKRFALWQFVYKNRSPYQKIVNYVNGSRLCVEKGRSCSTGNYYLGLLEYESMAFWMHYLRKEDTFVDVGANIGIYSLCGGVLGCRGVAIEPAADTCLRLNNNLKINSLSNVKVLQVGVSDVPGILRFSKGGDSVNHILQDDEDVSEYDEIKVDTLDSLLEQYDKVSGIKLDVEGFEEAVLNGAIHCINDKDCNFIICEVFSDKALCEKIKSLGFKMYQYDPKNRTLEKTELAGINNSIFIRDIDKARERVRMALPIEVFGHRI